jgi:tetratricopeptide (TPR) repeat protein
MREMKSNWLRTLRNSGFGFLCLSAVAAPWASAQTPAPSGPLPELNEGLLTVLGVDKTQIEAGAGADADTKKKVETVRREVQEAVRAFQQRNAQAALEDLEKAVDADKSLPPPSVMMARLCFASNDQNVVNLGRGFLERAVNFHRNAPEAYLLLGRLALAEGRLTDADLNFEKALANTPPAAGAQGSLTGGSWPDDRRNTFLKEVYAGQVSVSEQRQKWDEALAQLTSWLELDPNDAMAQFRKGRVLFSQEAQKTGGDTKNYDAARTAFTTAYEQAQKDPKRKKDELSPVPPPELSMLQLFSGSGSVDEAKGEVKLLESLVEGLPSEEKKEKGRIYSTLSQWYLSQNNATEAVKHAGNAEKADSESEAFKQLAAVMKYYSNDAGAKEDFAKMNTANPEDFTASNFLALLLAESPDKADKDKAVRLAELNVRLNPKSPEAVSTLGWVYHRAERTGEAMQVYGALMQAAQQGQAQISADTAYYMAKVIFASPATPGRLEAVVKLLTDATSSKGPFKHRAVAEEWLATLGGDTVKPRNMDLTKGTPTPTAPPAVNPGTNPGGNAPKPNPTPDN